jgi:hypothetical protein
MSSGQPKKLLDEVCDLMRMRRYALRLPLFHQSAFV